MLSRGGRPRRRRLALVRLPPRAVNLRLRPDSSQRPARDRMPAEAEVASGRERVARGRLGGARAENPPRPPRGPSNPPDRSGKRRRKRQVGPSPKRRAQEHLVPQRFASDTCSYVVNVVNVVSCAIKQTTTSQTELFSPLAPHTVLPALPSSSAESRSININVPSPYIAAMTAAAMTAGLDRPTGDSVVSLAHLRRRRIIQKFVSVVSAF